MDRSLYPEGVEVHQDDLQRTEDTRIFHILQRHIDNTLTGVVDGLIVTPNIGNPAIIDIASGFGYSPNGEFVELTNGITAIQLADSTAGILNLVCLIYTETNDDLEPHETENDSRATAANRSVRVRVFTQAQFDLLPESDNNLDNDSRDRALIVAAITAQGSGVSLITANIELPPVFGSAITVTNTTAIITGVVITAASPGTPNGTGSLEWDIGNGTLNWTAPEDTTGDNVNVLSGGSFQLRSLPSNNTLIVFVNESLLPVADQTDVIEVTNLYFARAPRHSAEDIHHRSLIGTGIPTINNPHGLTLVDLGIVGTPIEEHQNTFHSNGIRRDSDATALEAAVNTGTSPDGLVFTVPPNFFVHIRGQIFTIANDTTVTFVDVVDNTQILFEVYASLGVGGIDLEKRERARFDALSALTTHVQIRDISEGTAAGSATLDFDDSGSNLLTYTAPGDTVGGTRSAPVSGNNFLRLFSGNEIDFIDINIISTIEGIGNQSETLTISSRPTITEFENLIHITTAFFSGSGTGFIGNGFGVNNSPNDIIDKRLFGITGPFDARDDLAVWFASETSEAQSPAAVTNRQVGIIDSNYDFPVSALGGHRPFPDGGAGLTISHKAHVLGRGLQQQGLLLVTQYGTAEGGQKHGIRVDVGTDFSTGTITETRGIAALSRLKHVGGTITEASGLWASADVDIGATTTSVVGLKVTDVSGTTTPGADITTQYGILIDDQTKGTNNFAIKTGLGQVEFGDVLTVSGVSGALTFVDGPGIQFDQPITVGVPSVFGHRDFFQSAFVNSTIDGSTNPGNDGFRAYFASSVSPSTNLADFYNTDAADLANDAMVFDKTDQNTNTPDGSVLFVNTGADGVPDVQLILRGNGNVEPGFDGTQALGNPALQWGTVYAIDGRFSGGVRVGFTGNPPSDVVEVGDADFRMNFNSGTPRLQWEGDSYIELSRGGNKDISVVADGVNIFSILDVDNTAFGAHIKLSRTIYDGSETGAFFGQSSSVAHGITTPNPIVNTDTWGVIGINETSAGGMTIQGFTEAKTGISMKARVTIADSLTSTLAVGAIDLESSIKDGVSSDDTTLGSDDNLFTVSNHNSARFIIKGDGDVFVDGIHTTYDTEKDAVACQDLAYAMAGEWDKVIEYYEDDLSRLGIMENGFINLQAMAALQLGAIGEMYGVLNHLLKEQGLVYEDIRKLVRA